MSNPTDRRVRKTRTLLRQGLSDLMRQKSIQDITVKELCALCDLNRGTFYLHYSDVYALLAAIEAEMMEEFEQILSRLTSETPDDAPPSSAMCALFEFLADNAGMARVLLCNNGDMAFLEQVKQLVRERLMGHWSGLFSPDVTKPSGYTFAFLVSGCIGMLQQWLEGDMPVPPHEMATIVENVAVKGLIALSAK